MSEYWLFTLVSIDIIPMITCTRLGSFSGPRMRLHYGRDAFHTHNKMKCHWWIRNEWELALSPLFDCLQYSKQKVEGLVYYCVKCSVCVYKCVCVYVCVAYFYTSRTIPLCIFTNVHHHVGGALLLNFWGSHLLYRCMNIRYVWYVWFHPLMEVWWYNALAWSKCVTG